MSSQYIDKYSLRKELENTKHGGTINGLTLLKACAAFGMMINNVEIIEPENEYKIVFTEICSYDAELVLQNECN